MTDRQVVEHLRAVRMFCDPEQVQAIDRAIVALQQRMNKEKPHPVD